MSTDETRDRVRPELSELIEDLLGKADRMDRSPVPQSAGPVLATWWRREAHLATERAYAAMSAGVPDGTAWFLAVDDHGYQLAQACADLYYTT